MLSACGDLVRRHDTDRFFCTLFAPADRRETLFVLYAFDHELARARIAASNPLVAQIRLQWWREVVEGTDKRHEVATPLRAEIEAGRLAGDALMRMIDAREAETEPAIATLADWRAYLRGTSGQAAVIAGGVLGDSRGMAAAGMAWGAAQLLRAVPNHARQGRCLLPAEILQEHGLSPEAVISGAAPARVMEVVGQLARNIIAELGTARRPVRAARAAWLPAVFARRDLRRLSRGMPPQVRGTMDRIAVLRAALIGGS